MKLWRCTAEIEIVVASKTVPHEKDFRDMAEEEVRNNGFRNVSEIAEIKSSADLPDGWHLDCFPLAEGEVVDCTIADILDEIEAAERKRKEREPLPGQMELPLGETT